MKRFIVSILLQLLSFSGQSQGITIVYSESEGQILEVRISEDGLEFTISAVGKLLSIRQLPMSKSGGIQRISRPGGYCFTQDEVQFILPSLSHKELYDYHHTSRKNGKIKNINGIVLDYYDYHFSTLKNGSLKEVGDTEITYWDVHYKTVKQGRVKSIGSKEFDFHEHHYKTSENGKLSEINDIEIEYNDRYPSDPAYGKVNRIGNIEIEYFESARGAGLNGKLKTLSGSDSRLNLQVVQ